VFASELIHAAHTLVDRVRPPIKLTGFYSFDVDWAIAITVSKRDAMVLNLHHSPIVVGYQWLTCFDASSQRSHCSKKKKTTHDFTI
jgi:hypothetical protein